MGDSFEKNYGKISWTTKGADGALINNTIANGFKNRFLCFASWDLSEFIDISQNETDAAIEIQGVCPGLSIAKSIVSDSLSCSLRMEQEAARRTFLVWSFDSQ